jgi:hypothetical protein
MSYRLQSHLIPDICFEINNFLLSQSKNEAGKWVPDYILVESKDLETFKHHIKGVFTSYVRQDKKLTDQAIASMPRSGFAQEYDVAEMLRKKRDLAIDEHFPLGEDMPKYLANSILRVLWEDECVSDVFAEDEFIKKRVISIIIDFLRNSLEAQGTSVSRQHKHKISKSVQRCDDYFEEQTSKIYELAEKLGLGTYQN